MAKLLTKSSVKSRVNRVMGASVAAGMLAGCVATVRVPAPAVYVPPPAPAPAVIAVESPAVVEVQATEPPPPLPEYQQPPCPEDGWLWTPGYWAYSASGYYWIPGTWVAPPAVGVVWTPGYWAFVGGVYRFNAGYWAPHVGFYGGVNYGFGYGGVGFIGGRWEQGHFAYNTAVVNVNATVVHNTYMNTTVVNNTVINNTTVNRVSYNGPGGVSTQPTPAEKIAMAEPHTPPTAAQTSHVHEALRNPQLAAKANGGRPPIAATARPAAFTGPNVIGAKGGSAIKSTEPVRQGPATAAGTQPTARPEVRPSGALNSQGSAAGANGVHGAAGHAASQGPHPATPTSAPKEQPKAPRKPKAEDKEKH